MLRYKATHLPLKEAANISVVENGRVAQRQTLEAREGTSHFVYVIKGARESYSV